MAARLDKGKGKAIDFDDGRHDFDQPAAIENIDPPSGTASEKGGEYGNALQAASYEGHGGASSSRTRTHTEDEFITIDDGLHKPLPPLDPGILPPSYFKLGNSRRDGLLSMLDPDVLEAEKASASFAIPAPPIPPPELTKSGKPLTKKERKALKNRTAGPDWFDLPAPDESDLPRLYREVEALRLRNQLDPKRFYRKDEGEGKGIKGLPKYFAIGTVIPTTTPFGTASADNLTKAHRKRTLVDELMDDAETKHYAKKKFLELQKVRGAKGKKTLAQKELLRRPKW